MKIKISIMDHEDQVIEYKEGITAERIADALQKDLPYQILMCRIDGEDNRLTAVLDHDCRLELLDMRSSSANMCYQGSLILLYTKAVHDLFGKDVQVTIANSLNKGLFNIIRTGGLKAADAHMIQKRMEEIVEEDIPFQEKTVSREQMLKLVKENACRNCNRVVESAEDLDYAQWASLQNEQSLFYHHFVPSARYLKFFEVRRYKNGMLLRFPQPSNPNVIPEYHDQKLLYDAFSEATYWDKVTQIGYAYDLNEKVIHNDTKDLVLICEALHEKRIAEIADKIQQSGKRIILIAGPSSSGKTSFAKRLCIQLSVLGRKPLYLGTDDYFRDLADTPLDEKGKKDYESLNAVDTDLFASNMNDLLEGKKTDLPSFDFLKQQKIFKQRVTSIDESQPIVIEGIHALNPALTQGIDNDYKFKIYISPLTQLNIDEYNRIPTTDARMLRRLVRDYQFRGKPAQSTIDAWASVRAGEEKWIFPFLDEADAFFNSHFQYELAVLKKYAEPLLKNIRSDEKEYAEAQRMLAFLKYFAVMEDTSVIPNNSIIREFIGGSVLVK